MDITYTLEVTGDEKVLDKVYDILVEAGTKVRAECPTLDIMGIVFYGDNLLKNFP